MKEHCKNWLDNERCGKPAKFIVWGKLFPPEALGPRCYDCAASQIGHSALGDESYAVFDLRPSAPCRCRKCAEADALDIALARAERAEGIARKALDLCEEINGCHGCMDLSTGRELHDELTRALANTQEESSDD